MLTCETNPSVTKDDQIKPIVFIGVTKGLGEQASSINRALVYYKMSFVP